MNKTAVIIEIPQNSKIKYEYDRKKKHLVVDRILRDKDAYPCNYGFVPNTLDWDGDELDALVYSSNTFVPNAVVRTRVVGAMQMVDTGETDTKLLVVHEDDYRLNHIKTLEDIPKEFLTKVRTFFLTYKKHKGNVVQIKGFKGRTWALKTLVECQKLMIKFGAMPKKDFVTLMRQKHPDKYS